MSKNKGNILLPVISIIAIIAIAAAGYLYLQNQQLQKQMFVGTSSEYNYPKTPKPTITSKTSTWKTYRNSKLGFSTQIPANETVDETYLSNDWPFITFKNLNLTIANTPPQIGNPSSVVEVKRQDITLKDGTPVELLMLKNSSKGTNEIAVAKNKSFTPYFYFSANVPDESSEADFQTISQILSNFERTN